MARVTYHEFRPGHWVKLVDGEVAGPATADEVAKWRREKAEPDKIWQDVVEETTPAEAESVAPQDAVADTGIWQDVVRQVTPPSAESKPAPGTAAAKPVSTNELPAAAKAPPRKRAVEPEPSSKAEIAPVSKQAEPRVRREVEAAPAEEAVEARRAAPAKATPVEDLAGPKPIGTPQPVSVGASMPPSGTTAEHEVRVEDAAARKVEKTEAERVLEAEAVDKVEPERGRVRATVPTKKAAGPKRARAVEAVSDQNVEEMEPEPAPTVAAPAQATQAKQAPRSRRRTTRRRARAAAGAKSRKATGPSYLWVMAGPADDLKGAVRGGLARYEERFNEPAGTVLCHADDLPVLEQAGLAVDLRQGKGVPPRSFWIGPK